MKPNTEYIAFFGDVHGEAKSLVKILDKIKSISDSVTIFSTGDLFDRGPDSKEVLQLFMNNNIYSVLGNHDDCFKEVINSTSSYLRANYRGLIYDGMGGKTTVRSFLNIEDVENAEDKFVKVITKEQKDYINSIPKIRIIEFGEYTYLLNHAGIGTDSRRYASFLDNSSNIDSDFEEFLQKKIEHSLLSEEIIWNHKYRANQFAYLGLNKYLNPIIQVTGHMPTDEVLYDHYLFRIDTGSGKDIDVSKLSCIMIKNDSKKVLVFDSLDNDSIRTIELM